MAARNPWVQYFGKDLNVFAERFPRQAYQSAEKNTRARNRLTRLSGTTRALHYQILGRSFGLWVK